MDVYGSAERLDAASSSWAAVGTGPPIALTSAELWWVDLPFRHPVTTSVGTHSHRPLVLVRLVCRRDGRTVDGWGECAALGDTTYHSEDVAGAFDVLGRSLLPALVTRVVGAGGSSVDDREGARGDALAASAATAATGARSHPGPILSFTLA